MKWNWKENNGHTASKGDALQHMLPLNMTQITTCYNMMCRALQVLIKLKDDITMQHLEAAG